MRAVIRKRDRTILLPQDPRLMELIPEHRLEKEHMSLPHTHDVTRLARNFGYIVPAPILKHYKWPTKPKPFRTQKITAALLTMHRRAYVLSEMGTGKTRAALFASDFLREDSIGPILVIAPLSTLSQVWDREVFQHFNHLSTAVLHGTKKVRLKNLAEDRDVYIINHDGVGVIVKELAQKKFGVVIIDEIACLRNARTDRWKNIAHVVQGVPYVWGMTGAPTPNEPVDAWGQAKLLTPGRVPKWRKEFQRKTMTQITQFKWIPKPDANDYVFELLQPAVRYRRDDCMELPPVSYQTHVIELSKHIKDTYTNLIKKLTLAFKKGSVTALNEGVLFTKLLQISCGWVYTDDKGVIALDNRKRVEELLEIIEQSLGKVIVFACFKHAATELHKRLLKAGVDCSLVTGQTPKRRRDDIFGSFQNSSSPRVLVAHPQCMSHGLNLTQANTIVWFTPTTSAETYEQANARITRPGQDKKSLIIHLTGTPIEGKIYKRLQQKVKVQGALLDMFDDN